MRWMGKHVRRSRRGEHTALQVLALMGRPLRMVLHQEEMGEGGELTAALRLLERVDIES